MSGTNTGRLLPSNVTLLQPGSRAYRLSDALNATTASVNVTNASVSQNSTDIATLQGQVAALQTSVTLLQNQVQAMQVFQNSFSYLQAEVSTSTLFLDQRIIYKRSFVINGALNTAISVFTYPHSIANINYIVNIQAMAGAATAMQYPITFLNMATAPSLSTGISCWADATNIYIANGTTTFAGIQVLATMWYTATDR